MSFSYLNKCFIFLTYCIDINLQLFKLVSKAKIIFFAQREKFTEIKANRLVKVCLS